MKNQINYVLQYFPANREICIMHLSQKLLPTKATYGESPFCLEKSLEIKSAPDFIKEILKVDGAKSVSVNGYELTLLKARAFSWADFIEKVKSIISESCEADMIEFEEDHPIDNEIKSLKSLMTELSESFNERANEVKEKDKKSKSSDPDKVEEPSK